MRCPLVLRAVRRDFAFLLSLLFLGASFAFAHGGGLDSLGCHHDRKRGGYHCHRGPLAGRSFSSKSEALAALNSARPPAATAESAPPAQKQGGKLTAAEAKDHIGRSATVCGTVASARYAASSRGQPTFLNLDKPYPSHIFTVVIWGSERGKFGQPEVEFKGKRVCVTGTIESYRGVPQIEAKEPSQIELEKE